MLAIHNLSSKERDQCAYLVMLSIKEKSSNQFTFTRVDVTPFSEMCEH